MRRTIGRIGAIGAGVLLALGVFAAIPPAGASGAARHGVNSEDSTCFTATGQTQGRSHSDPDGMSNGGADKPGCPGGVDADRDGNNGCGNDADREDDNNGWCGRKPHRENAAPLPTITTTSTTTTTTTTAPTTVTVTPTSPEVIPTEPTDCQVDPKEATDCPVAAQASATGPRLTAANTAGTAAGDTTAAGATGTAGTAAGDSPDVDATTSTTAPATEVLGQTLERPSSLPRTGAAVGGLSLLGLGLFGGGRLTVLARRLLRIG